MIYPAVDALVLPADEAGDRQGGVLTLGRGTGDETAGVRPMRDGDDPRDIFWRKSTQPHQMVVRERVREARRDVTLVVESRYSGDRPTDEFTTRFERRIREVASRAHLDVSTLSRLETGKRRLTLDHLPMLADALGVTTDELLGAPGIPDPRVVARPTRRNGLTLWPLHHAGSTHRLQTFKVHIPASRRRPPAVLPVHDGHDWMYVLSGRLRLVLGDAEPTASVLAVEPDTGRIRIREVAPGDGTVTRASALMDERTGGEWRPRLQSPVRWTDVGFVSADHIALTRHPAFVDGLLYALLERPR